MNILMVKLSAVGDVVHTLPSLAALRRLYPRAHITWIVEAAAADLIQGHPALDRIIVSRRKHWIDAWRQGKWREVCREARDFFRTLRDRPYDLVIDFHGLFKSAILVGLSGGQRKLGYDSIQEGSRFFYNERIPEDMNKHAVDRYLDFLRYLGADPGPSEFLIPEAETNRNHVAALLREYNIDVACDRFIAVNPVALWETKLWNQGKFAELAQRIVGELNVPVVLTGSAAEKPYLDGIQKAMKQPVVNLAGKTSLRDLASLYRLASLVVTTDSGPMHIAAAVGTPVVALFGPTAPERTGPYGPDHTVIRRQLPCSPCFLKQCPSRRCMNELAVDDVFDAVRKKMVERKNGIRWEKEIGNGNQ